jgi:hypothetical protein
MQVRFTCPACKGSHIVDMPETTIHMTCSRTGKHLSMTLGLGGEVKARIVTDEATVGEAAASAEEAEE